MQNLCPELTSKQLESSIKCKFKQGISNRWLRETIKGVGEYFHRGRPQTGREAAKEALVDLKKAVGNADMVFVLAGMGGGTGTGGIAAWALLAIKTTVKIRQTRSPAFVVMGVSFCRPSNPAGPLSYTFLSGNARRIGFLGK